MMQHITGTVVLFLIIFIATNYAFNLPLKTDLRLHHKSTKRISTLVSHNYGTYTRQNTALYLGDDNQNQRRVSFWRNIRSTVFTGFRGLVAAVLLNLFASTSAFASKKDNIAVKEKQMNKKPTNIQQTTSVKGVNPGASKSGTGKSSKANNKVTSSASSKLASKGSKATDKKKKIEVEFVLTEKKPGYLSDSSNINKIGIGVVGIAILGSILSENKNAKKRKVSQPIDESFVKFREDRTKMLGITRTYKPIKRNITDQLRKSSDKLREFPTEEELFADESIDEIIESVSSKENVQEKKSEVAVKSPVNDISSFAEEAKPNPSPAAPQKKAGFFDRIFKKGGGDRPIDLGTALRKNDDPSYAFRAITLECLVNCLPRGYIPEWDAFYNDAITKDIAADEIKKVQNMTNLGNQDAGEAFAEVTNAILVTLVDKAAESLDLKNDNVTLAKLDVLADFVGEAGMLFSQTLPHVTIEPVQYNGKVKKSKLESLYLVYAKSSLSLSSMLAATGLTGGTENEDQSTGDSTSKLEKLGRLQNIFSIKEGKRNSLDQKIFREMLMSGDGGELGDLSGMLDAIKGNKEVSDLLQNGLADLGNIPGIDDDMQNQLKNMKPEEIAAMSENALTQVKESLRDGKVTKQDVEELEKVMGVDVKQLAQMIEAGQIDRRKLAELGPNVTDMLDVFKELAKIK